MLILLSMLFGCGAVQSASRAHRFDNIESEADALCTRSMTREEQRGLVVALYDHGEVWSRGYGTRSLDAEITPDLDTVFEIASITKTYTALLLADMVARGEVRLDTRLSDILPEGWAMHPSASEVTIEQVITHRSGLPTAWPGFTPINLEDPFDNLTEEVLREGLASAAVMSPPGSQHAYNNYAVSVLGLALADHLHMPFEEALQTRVLVPLGLHETWMDVPASESFRFADAVNLSGMRAPHWHLRAESAAGGLRASARDLLRYASAYLHPDAQPSPTLEEALTSAVTPRAETDAPGQRIGLAWFITQDGRTTTHSGRTAHDSQLFIDREGELIVVVLATNNTTRTGLLARNLLALMRGEPAEPEPEAPPPPITLTEAERAALVGAYQFEPGIVVRIRDVDGLLTVQATGQIAAPLRPVSATRLMIPSILAIDFTLTGDAHAASFTLTQGSHSASASRCREETDSIEGVLLPACDEASPTH